MARMPGAIWKPLAANWASQPRMRAFDIVCIHTMVGGLEGTDQQFRVVNGPGFVGTESHFGTGADGRIVQWQDTAYQAEANYNGNGHIISIENADWGSPFPAWSGSDVPAFTPAQVEAIAQVCAWANQTHGIPLELIPDSKPGRRGVAPHRWGVPGYVVPGGELWSTANRKACPGDRRIAQIPQIIARAKQIRGGIPATPTLLGDPDMRLVRTPDMSIYFVTDIEVRPVSNLALAGAASKAWGAFTEITWPELDALSADADARRARYAKPVVDLLVGGNTGGETNFHWLAKQITAAVASIPGAQVDQAALVAAIRESVAFTKTELADAAADEVAARLES